MEKTVIEEAIGAQARGQKGVYDFSGETWEKERELGRPRRRQKYTIKLDL
jgi:hypothetical protein